MRASQFWHAPSPVMLRMPPSPALRGRDEASVPVVAGLIPAAVVAAALAAVAGLGRRGGAHATGPRAGPKAGPHRRTRGMTPRHTASTCAAALTTLFLQSPAQAGDPIADFYQGKTIRMIIRAGVGGGYD